MIKTRIFSVTAGVLVAAAAFASNAAFAQQKTVLKASDVHPAGYPTVVAVENLGKLLGNGHPAVTSDAADPGGGLRDQHLPEPLSGHR